MITDSMMGAAVKFTLISSAFGQFEHAALDRAGHKFVEHIRAAIGTYEYGWEPLAESTIERKASGDTPLLESGELRDSYGYEIRGNRDLVIGSDNMKARWHEFGTSHIPPRPVIGGTLQFHGKEIFEDGVGIEFKAFFLAILGGASITSALRTALGGAAKIGIGGSAIGSAIMPPRGGRRP
jgi:phage gpG-like protein